MKNSIGNYNWNVILKFLKQPNLKINLIWIILESTSRNLSFLKSLCNKEYLKNIPTFFVFNKMDIKQSRKVVKQNIKVLKKYNLKSNYGYYKIASDPKVIKKCDECNGNGFWNPKRKIFTCENKECQQKSYLRAIGLGKLILKTKKIYFKYLYI